MTSLGEKRPRTDAPPRHGSQKAPAPPKPIQDPKSSRPSSSRQTHDNNGPRTAKKIHDRDAKSRGETLVRQALAEAAAHDEEEPGGPEPFPQGDDDVTDTTYMQDGLDDDTGDESPDEEKRKTFKRRKLDLPEVSSVQETKKKGKGKTVQSGTQTTDARKNKTRHGRGPKVQPTANHGHMASTDETDHDDTTPRGTRDMDTVDVSSSNELLQTRLLDS